MRATSPKPRGELTTSTTPPPPPPPLMTNVSAPPPTVRSRAVAITACSAPTHPRLSPCDANSKSNRRVGEVRDKQRPPSAFSPPSPPTAPTPPAMRFGQSALPSKTEVRSVRGKGGVGPAPPALPPLLLGHPLQPTPHTPTMRVEGEEDALGGDSHCPHTHPTTPTPPYPCM